MPAPDSNITNNLNNASWMETLLQGFAQYSQAVNKAVSGTLGGLASLFDFYGMYETLRWTQPGQQRKTKFLTYAISFALNALYACGAVLKFLSTLALSVLAVGIDIVALARISYITHAARNTVKKTKLEMEKIVDTYEHIHTNARQQRAVFGTLVARLQHEREHRFQSKTEVGYTVASTITSCMFIGGLFFPPLFTAGLITLITVKVVQFIDYRTKLAFSHFLSNTWNKMTGNKKITPPLKQVAEPKTVPCIPRARFVPKPAHSLSEFSPSINSDFNRPRGLFAGHTRLFQDKDYKNTVRKKHSADSKHTHRSHRR
jgi:hypothetical protein